MANNTITAIGIESLINLAWRNQANSYITTNDERVTLEESTKVVNGTIIMTRVLDPANSVQVPGLNLSNWMTHPGFIVSPGFSILGENTFQLDYGMTWVNKLSLALWNWANAYSAVRYCKFEVSDTSGPIPPFYRYCLLPVFTDALTISGITPSYIGELAGITAGSDINYQNLVDIIDVLKLHLQSVHEDSQYGTLQTFCHSNCHSSCHSSRNRR